MLKRDAQLYLTRFQAERLKAGSWLLALFRQVLFKQVLFKQVLFSAIFLLTACARPEPGWEQIDLCRLEHTTEPLAEPARDLNARIGHYPLGGQLFEATQASQPTARSFFSASIYGLEASLDVLIRWQVELGQEPYFTFRPMSRGTADCPIRYRVGVLTEKGVLHELWTLDIPPDRLEDSPRPKIVDLRDFAGQKLELLATVSPQDGACHAETIPTAVWGSPMLYSKKRLRAKASADRPNVILIGLDTVRADVLGLYGAEPSVTPSLDALAGESDVWLDAYASFNVTNPSFTSLMTGLYGKNHGVYDLRTPLPEERLTLAEILKDAGYATGAVLSARHLGDRQSGLGQGFDSYVIPPTQYAAETVTNLGISWISAQTQPFFLWLHLFDPHTPHTPPEPFSLGYAHPKASGLGPPDAFEPFRLPGRILRYTQRQLGAHRLLHFGELAYTDFQLGRLFDFLRGRGLLENTILIVVADHGENLGEYGIHYRHAGLWDTTTHVPLMIRWPGRQPDGRRLAGLVQTLDIFPTVLQRLGLDIPPGIDGQILAGMDGATAGRRTVFAEHSYGQGAMIRTREHLLMDIADNPYVDDGAYFYDLEADPDQTTNLAGRGLASEDTLRQALNAWRADRTEFSVEPATLSPEEIDQLRALGYVAQ